MRIGGFSPELEKQLKGPLEESGKTTGPSFSEVLKSKVMDVDNLQHQAEGAMREGAVKGATRIDETMIQLEEADLSLRFLVKVRSKAMEAYQEVMRMQF